MNIGITQITQNLGMSFEVILCMILAMGLLLFYAKDFKIGLIMSFFINGLLFMWFYYAGYNYYVPVIIMFMSLVMMALSLYTAANTRINPGGFV